MTPDLDGGLGIGTLRSASHSDSVVAQVTGVAAEATVDGFNVARSQAIEVPQGVLVVPGATVVACDPCSTDG